MKIIELFEAFDGRQFADREECAAYEATNVIHKLAGLTVQQIEAALMREDTDLADALEEIGNRCAKARRAAGELRRQPKTNVAAPAEPETSGAVVGPSQTIEASSRVD